MARATAMAKATAMARRTRARAKDRARARARDGRTDGRTAGRSYLFSEIRSPGRERWMACVLLHYLTVVAALKERMPTLLRSRRQMPL